MKNSPEFISGPQSVDAEQSEVNQDSPAALDSTRLEFVGSWPECEKHGDTYYRLMKEWVELKQSPKMLEKCLAAAHNYREALECYIDHCNDSGTRNLRTAIEYRSLLKRTMELLDSADVETS